MDIDDNFLDKLVQGDTSHMDVTTENKTESEGSSSSTVLSEQNVQQSQKRYKEVKDSAAQKEL